MNDRLLILQRGILAIGWVMEIAFGIGPGFDAHTLWMPGLLLVLTLFLVTDHWMPTSAEKERPHSHPPNWLDKAVGSVPGKILLVVLGLALIVTTGGLVGALVSVPLEGPAETIANLPDILCTGIIWSTMSVIGFGLFALLLSLLGPLLWVAYEAWIGFIAPVVGGVVGVARESGILGGVLLESGAIGRAIAIVISSTVVGALGLVMFEAITSEKKVSAKALSESLIAGLGFGLVNGLILAALSKLLETVR